MGVASKRTILGVLLIPFCYVVSSLLLDVTMFTIMGIPFPQYYAVSFFILVMLAAAVSCIPKRWIQITIFGACLVLQTFTTICNLLAFNNLGEIFNFEALKAVREIFAGAGASKYNGVWHFILVCAITVCFFTASILVAVKWRKRKSGYPVRPLLAVASAIMIMIAGLGVHLVAINKRTDSPLEQLLDPRFSLANFTNRTKVLHSFGSPMYYTNNLLHMTGIRSMASSAVASGIDMDWDGSDYYDYYDFMLDDYNDGKPANMIMLMLEAIELDAIHPELTPGLWEIRQMSTNVDGYHAIERTCFSEYVSLTGAHVMGNEMWRDYRNVEIPQSLPNIFRRGFEDAGVAPQDIQIGAFHTYNREFYARDRLFEKLGFNFIRDLAYYDDLADYDIPYDYRRFAWNSDYVMFNEMKEDMAPSDGSSFFSYILNVSTHSPHFGPNLKHTWYSESTDEYGSLYEDSLAEVLRIIEEENLEEKYIKLKQPPQSAERIATIAYLVGIKEFDRGLEVFLNHLKGVDEDGNKIRENNLLENTALLVYSDHFNYMSYNNRGNVSGGGLVSNTNDEFPIGEKIPFMIYNPKDTWAIENGGRTIKSFMANNDVYKTIAHLFNVETHGNFTLGSSVLARLTAEDWRDWPDISVGIGFYNGQFFGLDLDDPMSQFWTRDFKTYHEVKPSDITIQAFKKRLDTYASTLFKQRSYFDNKQKSFKDDERTEYRMGIRNT